MLRENRLTIYSITVENFKSYKGKHVIGPFCAGFNAIVGPNGSGKSNVIDAVLFVLGFRAKRLRHSKSEDLIHSGPPSAEFASVQIDFASPNLSIKREVTSKGKSTYTLNDKTVTLEVLTTTLKSYSLDLVNNRFMVLQGEIESIAHMKPKGTPETPGLVEYLEEAIGTTSYIERIKEAELRLNAVVEANSLVQAEAKFAGRALEHAESRAATSLLAITKHKSYLKQHLVTAIQIEAQSATTIQAASAQLVQLNSEIQNLTAQANQAREIAEQSAAAHELAQNKARLEETAYLSAKRAYETADLQYRRKVSRREMQQQKIQSLTTELATQQRLAKEATAQIETANSEIAANLLQIKAAQQVVATASQEIEKARVPTELSNTLSAAEQDLLSVITRLQAAREKARKRTREVEAMEGTQQRRQARLQEIPLAIEQAKSSAKSFNADKAKRAQQKLQEVRSDREATLAELQRRQVVLQDLQRDAESAAASGALSSLSRIKGFLGRLRDLGSIPDKYALALGASARGSLNHLVVETTKSAELVLDALRNQGLGRHTIIVLDKIAPIRPRKDGVRLIDQITAEPKVLPAFYFVIGETLLVKTPEEAMKRAFAPDRPRVVSLCGRLIDRSGLMSGGAVRKAELSGCRVKKPQGSIPEAEVAVTEAKDGLALVEAALERAEERVATYQAAEKAAAGAQALVAELEKELDRLTKEPQTNPKLSQQDLKKAMSEVLALEKAEAKAEQKRAAAEAAVSACMGAGYREAVARAAGATAQATALEERNTKLAQDMPRVPDLKSIEEALNAAQTTIEPEPIPAAEEEKTLARTERSMREALEQATATEKAKRLAAKDREEADAALETAETQRVTALESEAEAQKQRQMAIEKKKRIEARLSILQERLGTYWENLGAQLNENNQNQNQSAEQILSDNEENCEGNSNATRSKRGQAAEFTEEELASNDAEMEGHIRAYLEFETARATAETAGSAAEASNRAAEIASAEVSQLKEKRVSEFLQGLHQVNTELRTIYNSLTLGGTAELDPVDYADPFSEGVAMSVMPPRKSWKRVSHLSGGERTLSSLSLIFALHALRPSSFYVMDEVDAALDYKNVGVVGRFIASRANDCQFLVVSLRENMYELASAFIGVYRPADTTLAIAVSAQSIESRDDDMIKGAAE
ncbi:structural maintenance of chromosome 4 [Nematocida homosporus]|uniref:structural maintenance of chromosome 4 n=1 Tax=Nematocida homosporus TaxID=1912981 RepID=UPI002220E0AC|nr:structural maintenance of chromosome 4 [Nematocida homosporus]KAI5186259.1 structural maintenance of chromosome 4 [Nematocida homosporus]